MLNYKRLRPIVVHSLSSAGQLVFSLTSVLVGPTQDVKDLVGVIVFASLLTFFSRLSTDLTLASIVPRKRIAWTSKILLRLLITSYSLISVAVIIASLFAYESCWSLFLVAVIFTNIVDIFFKLLSRGFVDLALLFRGNIVFLPLSICLVMGVSSERVIIVLFVSSTLLALATSSIRRKRTNIRIKGFITWLLANTGSLLLGTSSAFFSSLIPIVSQITLGFVTPEAYLMQKVVGSGSSLIFSYFCFRANFSDFTQVTRVMIAVLLTTYLINEMNVLQSETKYVMIGLLVLSYLSVQVESLFLVQRTEERRALYNQCGLFASTMLVAISTKSLFGALVIGLVGYLAISVLMNRMKSTHY